MRDDELKTNYVLIDFENVHVKSLALLQGDHFRVHVFLGPNNAKLPADLVLAIHQFGDRASYTRLEASGNNALDFHLAYYLGGLVSANPEGFFHIISKDTGFDPLIKHLKAKKILAARSESIEGMTCFRLNADAVASAAGPVPVASAADGNGLDAFVKAAIDDLIKRKASRPRKVSTLRTTVLSRIGKDAESNLDAVIAALVRAGYVRTEGGKVTYNLPA